MATHDFGNFRKRILDDFDRQTQGLEDEFGDMISRKLSDAKIDTSGMSDSIRNAIKIAFRDVKKDKIDGINLADFIDENPDQLRAAIKTMYENLAKGVYSESAKYEEKVTKALVGAVEVANKRGVKLNMPKIFEGDIQEFKEVYNITDKTVSKINSRLSEIGVDARTDKAMSLIESLGVQNLMSELDKIETKTKNVANLLNEFYKKRASTQGHMDEYGLAFDSKSGKSTKLIEGGATGISYKSIHGQKIPWGSNIDSMMHFHSDELEAAFSFDDIRVAAAALQDKITKNFVGAMDNIAALDTSSLSQELLLKLSDKMKELTMTDVPGFGLSLDETKAFQEVKNNFDKNIEAFVNQTNQSLGDVFGSSLSGKLKSMDFSKMVDDDEIYNSLANVFAETAKDLKMITDSAKVQSAFDESWEKLWGRVMQQFQEKMLRLSFKEVAPNVDFDQIYKKIPTADYKNMLREQQGGFNPFESGKSVETQNDLREEIKETAQVAETTGEKIKQAAQEGVEATEKLADAQEEVIENQKELAAVGQDDLSSKSLVELVSLYGKAKESAGGVSEETGRIASAIRELLSLDPSKFEAMARILNTLNSDNPILTDGTRTLRETVNALDQLSQMKTFQKSSKEEVAAQEELKESVEKTVEAKKEEQQVSDVPQSTAEIKAEAEARQENAKAIQAETEAKKESSDVTIGIDAYEKRMEYLKQIADDAKKAYEDAVSREKELESEQSALMKTIEEATDHTSYDKAIKNAKKYNLSSDDLFKQAQEHAQRGYGNGMLDTEQMGKAAGYYKLYVDSLQDVGAEMQKVVVDGEDLSKELLEVADTIKGGVVDDNALDRLKTLNKELLDLRDNKENLKSKMDVADTNAQSFEAILEKERSYQNEQQKQTLDGLAAAMERRKQKAEEEAAAQKKVTDAVEETTAAKKEEQAITDGGEAVANAEKEAEAEEKATISIKRKAKAKQEVKAASDTSNDVSNTEKETAAVTETAQAYEKKTEAVREANAVTVIQTIKSEDLSPVLMQLTNIIGLLERKNNLFIREGNIVTEEAARESSSLQGVANVLKEIVGDLQALNGKGLKLSFSGLSNLKQLTELDVDKLDERLIGAFDKIADFAKELGELKVDDSSFVKSINDMLKHGEELKNLAIVLRASKKQIQEATEVTAKPKAQPKAKTDLSEWKELNKVVKEYYELKNTDSDKLTQSEQGRLTEIEGLWAKVRGEVEKTTAALKEQGQSTKLIEDVTRAYTTGFAEWQNQQMANGLNADRTDLSKLSERFNKRLNDYPSKYVEEAKQQVQQLTAMVDALNAKPIDVSKPEDIAQIRKEIDAAKELANAIQQGFNSADWKVANQTKVSNLQNEISMYMKNFSALSEETKGKLHALIEELDHIGSNEGLAQAVQKFNKIKIAARDAGEEGTSFFSKMGRQIEHLNAQAFAMYLSWQDIIRYIRQAAGAVIELDSALTELRKVSDASTERLQQSFETSAKTAKELGSTVDSVINQTADWSRVGFKIDEAEQLARITTLFQTVGDNMTTESASEAMISTLKGFEMGVDQAEDIVDKYNIILAVLLFRKSKYG